MIRFDEAERMLLALVSPLASERLRVDDACDRVLAEDVTAPADLPAFDYSAMDGYAVRAGDFEGNGPFRVRVAGESRTGEAPAAHTRGTAMRIFTGAEVCAGADAVVMQEHVKRDGDCAEIAARPRVGANVRRRGEDMREGAIAISKGTRLRPAHLALAATVDRAELEVSRRPRVAIIATGDELRPPGAEPRPGTIPESNTVALRAIAMKAGASVCARLVVKDDPEATEKALESAFGEADVVVTIGGVSVGDHDHVRGALEKIGAALEFWKVAIKPGKPLAVGRKGSAIVLGLPGNPASALVTFALLGVPLLRAMQGDVRPRPTMTRAKLTRALAHDPGPLELVRATLGRNDAGLTVTPASNQSSGAVTIMASSDALIWIAAESTGFAAGHEVDVVPFSELGL